MNQTTIGFRGTFTAEDLKKDLNKTQTLSIKTIDRSLHYRDVAILRFWNRPTKVLNENQFTFTFLKRQNDQIWNELMVVQTNIKAKLGTGRKIQIKFYAPIIDFNSSEPIYYDYERMGDDYDIDEEEF